MIGSALAAIAGNGAVHFAVALVVNGLARNLLFVGGGALPVSASDPDERAMVQGANELLAFAPSAAATFASGALYSRRPPERPSPGRSGTMGACRPVGPARSRVGFEAGRRPAALGNSAGIGQGG